MPRINLRARKRQGRSTIYYTHAKDESGHSQLCVVAECHAGDTRTHPIWGHGQSSVKKALATLTRVCDCPANFHKAIEFEGHKVHTSNSDD